MHAARQQWTAWRTEHRSESLAARALRGIAPETYCPLYRERAKRGGTRRAIPVLQGYLLVMVDRRAPQLGEIARARGMAELVGDVGSDEVAWLRGLEDELGYVVLDDEQPPAFAFGESVLALSGAFRDQRGTWSGIDQSNSRRARVAFEILGRVVESSVPRYHLAPG